MIFIDIRQLQMLSNLFQLDEFVAGLMIYWEESYTTSLIA